MTKYVSPTNDLAFRKVFGSDDNRDVLRVFTFYDRKRKKSFATEYLTLAYFEYGKPAIETEAQRYWKMYFSGEELPEAAPAYIKKAAQLIEYANLKEEERIMIDRMQRARDIYDNELYTAWHDGEIQGKMDGLKEGRVEGRMEVAKNALSRGMAVSDIAGLTGLTETEITSLMS